MLASASYTESGDGPYRHDLPPGEGEWTNQGDKTCYPRLFFTCPCGCHKVFTVPCWQPGDTHQVGWKWNGNETAPTLHPSILIYENDGKTEHWHGHLVDGCWNKC